MKRVIILLAALVLLAPSLDAQEQQKIDKKNLVIKEWDTDARSNIRVSKYCIGITLTDTAVKSNHAARMDYVFCSPAVWPKRLNYVVGYNEFFPDSRDALRWDFLLEEMHRFRGGEWKENPYRHTD